MNENDLLRGWNVNWSKEEIKYLLSFFAEDDIACLDRSKEGFGCTRKSGHPGVHVAHGYSNEICAIWD